MPTVLLLHGLSGSPRDHWFPWLKANLLAKKYTVVAPQLPNPGAPDAGAWLAAADQHVSRLAEDSIVIGYDLGSALALRLIERRTAPVAATILVASVWERIKNKHLDPLTDPLTQPAFRWPDIQRNAGEIHVLHADNDPQIWLTGAQKLASHLGVKIKLVRGGRRLDTRAGFAEFPLLLDLVLSIRHRE